MGAIERIRSASTIKPGEKRLQVKSISSQVDLESFYLYWFGILSKMAHPSPGLIIDVEAGKEAVSIDDVKPIFIMGTQSAIEILTTALDGLDIRASLEAWIDRH